MKLANELINIINEQKQKSFYDDEYEALYNYVVSMLKFRAKNLYRDYKLGSSFPCIQLENGKFLDYKNVKGNSKVYKERLEKDLKSNGLNVELDRDKWTMYISW